jgi:hypothetical protein
MPSLQLILLFAPFISFETWFAYPHRAICLWRHVVALRGRALYSLPSIAGPVPSTDSVETGGPVAFVLILHRLDMPCA